ncbi:MAG: pilus assembly protein PilM [Lentisphaeria bacterium]|nr:pilus assembly protein PilM [Lentisphaeria bacterium]MBQ7393593.1 pilus assembly protein PilM [Lentisphaeria bacterium]
MAKQENTVLAVDIGGGCLKMAEFGTTESGAIVLQRFAVKELSDREMDPVLSFAVAYNALLAENEFKAKAVNLSISGASSFSRLSKLPQLSGSSANVAKIVEFEASTVVPYDMNEVVWGYQLLKHTVQVEREIETVVGEDQSQPKVEVEDVDEFEALFVAVKSDQIDAYTDVILNSGKKVLSVDIAPVAMFNAAKVGQCQDETSTLLLNIGARCTSLVIAEGERIFVRNIPIAGDTITAQISKEFNISFQEAEDLKVRYGFVALGGAYDEPESEVAATISKIARNVMTRLHGEINRSFSVWRSAHGGTTPKRMLLAGGGSLMHYTQEFFQEKLRIDVDYLNVFIGIQIGEEVNRQKLLDIAPMFSELIGMGLRHLGICPVDISLVPERIIFQQDFVQKRPYFYGSALLILFCLACFLMAVLHRAEKSNQMVRETRGEVEKTLKMQSRIKKLNGELGSARGEYEEAMSFVRARSSWTDMLLELQSMIPNNMFLVSLEGKGTEIAPAQNQSAMDDMMMDPGLFGPMDAGGGDPSASAAKPKEDFTLRHKHPELITEVKELKLHFYTLALRGEATLIEDKFRQKLKTSKYFSNEKDGYELLSHEAGHVKDGLTSFVVLVKLKEPIRK